MNPKQFDLSVLQSYQHTQSVLMFKLADISQYVFLTFYVELLDKAPIYLNYLFKHA